MSIIVPVAGVAFAAFAVWLAVRVVNRRERWAKRTATVLVVFLALYPLSIGPAEWMRRNGWLTPWIVEALTWFYSPLGQAYYNCPEPLRRAMDWYANFWV